MTALALTLDQPLSGPFHTPPSAAALQPTPATLGLVESQVNALLQATPSYHALGADERKTIASDLMNIAGYAAECMREICWQSEKLGQVPVQRDRKIVEPVATAQEDFQPRAAGQIARVTQETLRAIAFPTFVADLIGGTFRAITETTIQQMESFGALLANVRMTVDQFMASNISDNQARDWLAQRYPDHMKVKGGKLTVREGADDREPPAFKIDLNLPSDVSMDESEFEEILVPAARRRLAETRLQTLSTLVLMGMNRIVITGGKIRATMGFHIDTTDRLHEERATDMDLRVQAAAQLGFSMWSASASTSFSYVTSTRTNSDAEINVETDLTGEVELHFKSDYFPLSRFANSGAIAQIQNNTANPDANAPSPEAAGPFDAPPTAGGEVTRYKSPRTKPKTPQEPLIKRPMGSLPDVKKPDGVAEVEPVKKRPEAEKKEEPPAEQKPEEKAEAKPPDTQPVVLPQSFAAGAWRRP